MDNEATKQQINEAINEVGKSEKPHFLDIVEKYKINPFVIYGIGRGGKQVYSLIKTKNIAVRAFIDKSADEGMTYDNIPVYNVENFSYSFTKQEKDKCIVFIAFSAENDIYDGIINLLKSAGFKKIYNYLSVRFQYRRETDMSKGLIGYNYYVKNLPEIFSVSQLLEDERSLDVFARYIKSYIKQDLSQFSHPDKSEQYFPDDIEFSKGYSRFIDCGAYDGDTAKNLFDIKGKIERMALFEPSAEIFVKLADWLCENSDVIADEVIALPCGVYDRNSVFQFSTQDIASSIAAGGTEHIQCVTIDNVLYGFAPTFIKMDIEGSEHEALLGAQKTIRKYKPDLAICVYHYANDIWKTPLLINSWNLGYRFYLRTYSSTGYETVLYATSKE